MAQDCLHLCNEFQIPSEDFEMQHCARCFQSECTRSLYGKGQFDQRVSTWEQRLFTNVPRMDESDPRYKEIQAKKFVGLDNSPVPEVGRSAWVDPRDLDDGAPEYKVPETKRIEAQTIADLQDQGPAKVTPKVDDAPPKPQIPEESVDTPFMNTPDQPGRMLGGREKPTKLATSDPWEPKKEPSGEKGQVVKPGARIRFGGSGV